MQTSDRQLLRQYVESGSQAAFARLVERHMAMVYWTCRRDVKDADLAHDAAQAVFLLLAQKAKALTPSDSLSGWLFAAARYTAKSILRSQNKQRRLFEEAAKTMQQSYAHEPIWGSVEPWLNDAISNLPFRDREAVLMRYFEGMSADEIAQATGSTDTAVRMRLSRALDKLRQYLLRKEVAVAPAALAALLTEHPAKAAPIDCAAAATHALHTARITHALPALNSLLGKGLIIMSSTKLIAAGTAAVILLLGVGLYGYHRAHSTPANAGWQAPPAVAGTPSASSDTAGLVGTTWTGTWNPAPGQRTPDWHPIFHILGMSGAGSYTATQDCPEQNEIGRPARVTITGNDIVFADLNDGLKGYTISGTLSGNTVDGTDIEVGRTQTFQMPITMTKS